MDARTAPRVRRPADSPSKSRLKHEICTAVQQLTRESIPAAWHNWPDDKVRQFIQDVQGCHTARSLHGLQLSAERVVEAYGRTPREILPRELFA